MIIIPVESRMRKGEVQMKFKVSLVILLISVLIVGFGCSESDESIKTEMYSGRSLSIGIIGQIPKIREENVRFTVIDFDALENVDQMAEYDAIYITKDQLEEADKPKYAKVYMDSHTPFLFIEAQSHVPFVYEDIELKDYLDWNDGVYAILYDQDSEEFWDYGLYNDKVNEQNIQATYSLIFKKIEEVS